MSAPIGIATSCSVTRTPAGGSGVTGTDARSMSMNPENPTRSRRTSPVRALITSPAATSRGNANIIATVHHTVRAAGRSGHTPRRRRMPRAPRGPSPRPSRMSAGSVARAGVNIIAAATRGSSGSASPLPPSQSGSATSQDNATEAIAKTTTASQGTRAAETGALMPPR